MKFGTVLVLLSLLLSGFSTSITGRNCPHHTKERSSSTEVVKSGHHSSMTAERSAAPAMARQQSSHCPQMAPDGGSTMAHCAVSSDQTPDTCPCLHEHDPIAVRTESTVIPTVTRDWMVSSFLDAYTDQQRKAAGSVFAPRIDAAPPDLGSRPRLHLQIQVFLN
jgi:hypothetical protein